MAKVVSIRLSEENYEYIKEFCAKRDRKPAYIMSKCISNWVRYHKLKDKKKREYSDPSTNRPNLKDIKAFHKETKELMFRNDDAALVLQRVNDIYDRKEIQKAGTYLYWADIYWALELLFEEKQILLKNIDCY